MMAAKKHISVKTFCLQYEIETDFIYELHNSGLIDLIVVKRTRYIPISSLPQLEKIIRLHTELDINIPGIETIFHLLESLDKKEKEIRLLKNKLNYFRLEE